MDSRRWIWFVLMGLGCGGTSSPAVPCEDPECRQVAVLDAWEEGHEQGLIDDTKLDELLDPDKMTRPG